VTFAEAIIIDRGHMASGSQHLVAASESSDAPTSERDSTPLRDISPRSMTPRYRFSVDNVTPL
jgi:hypothetical protein